MASGWLNEVSSFLHLEFLLCSRQHFCLSELTWQCASETAKNAKMLNGARGLKNRCWYCFFLSFEYKVLRDRDWLLFFNTSSQDGHLFSSDFFCQFSSDWRPFTYGGLHQATSIVMSVGTKKCCIPRMSAKKLGYLICCTKTDCSVNVWESPDEMLCFSVYSIIFWLIFISDLINNRNVS